MTAISSNGISNLTKKNHTIGEKAQLINGTVDRQ